MLKVLQRAPNNGLARRILVGIYLQSGQSGRALEALKPILHSIESNSDMLALAGEVYLRNRGTAEAANYFAKASTLDASNAGKRTALALSQIAAGHTETGIRELERTATGDNDIRSDLTLIAVYLRERWYD